MQGELSEFTMAELLQLFALAERTGTLVVHTQEGASRVLLESGRVIGIGQEDLNVHELIMTCELMPTRSGASLSSVTPTPQTPGLSFIVRNLVEPERWELFARRCVEQEVYPYLTRERGSFNVEIDRVPFCPLAVNMSVQQLVLDGSRWQSEMQEHRQDGYTLASRFQRGDLRLERTSVTSVEWLIWSILDCSQSVGTIAKRVGIPDLDALSTVRKLHTAGWLDRS